MSASKARKPTPRPRAAAKSAPAKKAAAKKPAAAASSSAFAPVAAGDSRPAVLKPAVLKPALRKPDPQPMGGKKKSPGKPEGKKLRGTFVMPEADHALIAKLKLAAKRSGLKVKKSELFRLGLRALDALGTPELRDRVLSLRSAPAAKRNGK